MCHHLPLSGLLVMLNSGVPRTLVVSGVVAAYCAELDLTHTDASVSWCGVRYGVPLGILILHETFNGLSQFALFFIDFRTLLIGSRAFVRIQRFFRKHRARRREQRMVALCMADSLLARVVRVLCEPWDLV